MSAIPKKATTVTLIRDNSGRIEVLLMRRHIRDMFLPDYYVFPGGALEEHDLEYPVKNLKTSIKLEDFDNNYNNYISHIICGIRETFEESGILIAFNENEEYPLINEPESIRRFTGYRGAVHENKLSLSEMLLFEKLIPAFESFHYINRWITPSIFPIRYDARFFAVVAPEGQEISHDNNELVDYRWFTPDDALKQYGQGQIKLVMPTISTLELLQGYNHVNDVIDYLRKRMINSH